MKKIIVILFLFFNYSYSINIGDYAFSNSMNFVKITGIYTYNVCSYTSLPTNVWPINSYGYYVESASSVDYTCALNNAYLTDPTCYNGDQYYILSGSAYNFCNQPGCVYNSDGNFWNCDNNIICPEGQTYNSSTEQCEDIPECPTTDELDQQAIQKCGSLDWVQNEFCDPNTGEVTITCKSCEEIAQSLIDYCSPNSVKDGEFDCSMNSDGSLTISISSFSQDLCFTDDNNVTCPEGYIAVTDESGNTTCQSLSGDSNETSCPEGSVLVTNSDGTTSCESLTSDNNDTTCPEGSILITNSDGTTTCEPLNNDSSDTSTSDSTTNTDSSTSDDNTCPDPCYLYEHKPVGFQTSTSIVDGYTCYTITYPSYDNCSLQYHFLNGQCVSGCGDTAVSSVNNSDINITLDTTPITSRIDKTNEKLDEINQKLDEFKNMTPDSNFSVEGSIDSDIESFFNTYKDFFNNIGSDLENIKGSFDSVKSMLKKDQYSLSLPSDIYQCPLTITLYKTTQSIDICKFISPYRPLLQIFFTLFFNISVLAFFFKVIINRGEK